MKCILKPYELVLLNQENEFCIDSVQVNEEI